MKLEKNLKVRRVAVLGAGVMGAQIAAHFVYSGIPTYLYDLADKTTPNGIVNRAIASLHQLKPAPLALSERGSLLEACNYDNDLPKLSQCDFVIEAIAERLDWKLALYEKVLPHLSQTAVLVTNTSGLSLSSLSESFSAAQQRRFCGVHFFNPPRYMPLVELIPTSQTDPALLDSLETFLTTALGKTVVRAKDTPNFIANRIGVFSMLATLHHASALGIPFEVVDELTGPLIGRAKSATFRTMDVVGLDTMSHVIQTFTDNLPRDPWHAFYKMPAVLSELIAAGALGQKTKRGVFQKVGKDIHVYDPQTKSYRLADRKADPAVIAILKEKDLSKRFAQLRESTLPEAQFLWRMHCELFHYTAYHLADIADTVRDVDLAIRSGFAWKQGPFEIWQQAGFSLIRDWIEADRQAKQTMSDAALPQWVHALQSEGVYQAKGAYSPTQKNYVPRSALSVYARQPYPQALLAETFSEGETAFETEAIRLWHQNDGIGILSFKTKMNVASLAVLEGIIEAVEYAENHFDALVLWQRHGDNFCVGANLNEFISACEQKAYEALDKAVATFQQASLALRYAQIPVVAAVQGYVFGGGCELAIHCDKIIAAQETYIGLVEVGVGLLPAGGGCKEFARRSAEMSPDLPTLEKHISRYYQQIAKGDVAQSGLQAKSMGFLQQGDVVLPNSHELLFVAKAQAKALSESAYRPPFKKPITVLGKQGIADCQMLLINMLEGGFISEHDYEIGLHIARVICGGELERGTQVDEAWLLRLEREAFVTLAKTEKTQARIMHMLKQGKPLRN